MVNLPRWPPATVTATATSLSLCHEGAVGLKKLTVASVNVSSIAPVDAGASASSPIWVHVMHRSILALASAERKET